MNNKKKALSLNKITSVRPENIRSLDGITNLKPDSNTSAQSNNIASQQSHNQGIHQQSEESSKKE